MHKFKLGKESEMNWTELLKTEIESTYAVTEGLLNLVEDTSLDWQPPLGNNWMTVGQLLHHLVNACGAPMRGFVTGDWGRPPEGGHGMPPKLPTVESVAQAKTLLAADKKLALEMLARCSEDELASKPVAAPWSPNAPKPLGYQILHMIDHLKQHKGQLFYYLKLQGKPVHTGHLWGM